MILTGWAAVGFVALIFAGCAAFIGFMFLTFVIADHFDVPYGWLAGFWALITFVGLALFAVNTGVRL